MTRHLVRNSVDIRPTALFHDDLARGSSIGQADSMMPRTVSTASLGILPVAVKVALTSVHWMRAWERACRATSSETHIGPTKGNSFRREVWD